MGINNRIVSILIVSQVVSMLVSFSLYSSLMLCWWHSNSSVVGQDVPPFKCPLGHPALVEILVLGALGWDQNFQGRTNFTGKNDPADQNFQ